MMATPMVVPASPPAGGGTPEPTGNPVDPAGPTFQSCLDEAPDSTAATGPTSDPAGPTGQAQGTPHGHRPGKPVAAPAPATQPASPAADETAAIPEAPATPEAAAVAAEPVPPKSEKGKEAKDDDLATAAAPTGEIATTGSPALALQPVPVVPLPEAPQAGPPQGVPVVPAAPDANIAAAVALTGSNTPDAVALAADSTTTAQASPATIPAGALQAPLVSAATTNAQAAEASTDAVSPSAAIPPKKAVDPTAAATPWAVSREQIQQSATPAVAMGAASAAIAASAQDASAAAGASLPAAPAEATPVPVVISSRIEHLPATARAVMQTSARTGISRARIELRPPELGHVEIRLRYSSDGVKATVTASSPAAAQALTSSAGDLKRALEAQGLTVLGLDVGHTGTDDGRRPEGGADGPFSQPSATGGGDDGDADEQTVTTTSTIRIPAAGSSVDVLA
jgi:flagellar hook-length control protein FliK